MEVNRTKLRNEYISVGTEYWKDLNDKPNLPYVIFLEDKIQSQQEEISDLKKKVELTNKAHNISVKDKIKLNKENQKLRESIIDLVWLIDSGATMEELIERIQLLNK